MYKLSLVILLCFGASSLWASAEVVPIEVLYSKTYEKCMRDAMNEYDALTCTEHEITRADKKLNIAYKEAMKRVAPFRRNDLRNVERQWMKYRDTKCNFLYHKESGSAGLGAAAECKLNETIKRSIELQNTY